MRRVVAEKVKSRPTSVRVNKNSPFLNALKIMKNGEDEADLSNRLIHFPTQSEINDSPNQASGFQQ